MLILFDQANEATAIFKCQQMSLPEIYTSITVHSVKKHSYSLLSNLVLNTTNKTFFISISAHSYSMVLKPVEEPQVDLYVAAEPHLQRVFVRTPQTKCTVCRSNVPMC